MNTKTRTGENIKKMTAVAVFAALAYVIHFVHIPVAFLNLDFKDVVMTIAGMYFGPSAAAVLAFLVPILEYPTSETGPYGLIMNILSSGAFAIVASVIYKFKKTLSGAIIALCSATLSMVAVMMLANLFVTPYYMHVTQADVVGLIPTLLLPFNAVKAVLNAALTLCLYKPISKVLKKSGFGRKESVQTEEENKNSATLRSVLVWTIGGAIAIAAFCIIFFVLGGKIAFN
jgi:ECF transporter S component (folate family)